MTNHKRNEFCWNELATPNIKSAKEFYANSFGWTFTDHNIDDGTYSIITTNDKEFAGMWEIPRSQQQQIPPHWMSYILVENLEESLKKVSQNGGLLKVPTTPMGDFGQFAIIIDPTGAPIALWESLRK